MATLLEQAAASIKAGDIEKGKQLLIEVLKQNPKDENAWLWMSRCVTDAEQKKDCFRRVLAINPSNEIARQALDKLTNHIAQRPAKPTSKKQELSVAKILIGSLVGLFLLSLCGVFVFIVFGNFFTSSLTLNNPQQPSATEQRPIVNAPDISLTCQKDTVEYIQQIQPLLAEFNDSVKVANSTARIALGPIVQDMQRIRREIETITAPDCAQSSSRLLIRGVDYVINAFISFMGNEGDVRVSLQLQQGTLDIENASNQLLALGSGQATPIPKQMPTSTAMATLSSESIQILTEIASPPTQTPTPLPSGQSISIDELYLDSKWKIEVDRIIIADKLTSPTTGTTEKALGRFAIVFLKVTNRGLSEEVFSAKGNLVINDTEHNQSLDNEIAALLAHEIYDVDYIASINPDDTKIAVAVFDISKQSSFYVLAPGEFAKSDSSGLLLNLP